MVNSLPRVEGNYMDTYYANDIYVDVCFDKDDLLWRDTSKGNYSPKIIRNCLLINLPHGEGDTIRVKTPEGVELLINPYNSNFVGLVYRPKETK